ncbi:DUF4190 domain-containing protein [Promicromonospora sp. Marseille-Q5078]
MSHPQGYDPHDARPTQVFPPREDGTAVLPATWEQSPQGDTGAAAALPQGLVAGSVAGPGPPPAPAPSSTRLAAAPAAGAPAPHAAAPYESAPRAAVPQSWDSSPSAAPRHAPGHGGQPAGTGRQAPGSRGGTEPTAVAALITGIFGFVVPLLGVLAIILGGVGLDRTRRRGTGGRGMAATGVTFGSIQVVFTALVVIAGIWAWNTYGDDIEAGLAQAEDLTQTDLSVPDLLLGGVTGDLSFGDLQDLAGTLGQADELQNLGGECQAGDAAACDDLLGSLPDGVKDQLPQDLLDQLPSGG